MGMARIMQMRKTGSGTYEVSAEASGNLYEYDLKASLFTREETFRRAALMMTAISDAAFRTAAMIRLMLEGGCPEEKLEDMFGAWREQALCLDTLAMMVPRTVIGVKTGSSGGDPQLIQNLFEDCEKIRAFLVRNAPGTWQGGEDGFKKRWVAYALTKDFATSLITMVNKEFNRAGNVPALVARSPSAPAVMRAWAMNQATKNIPDLVPLKEDGPRIIRGDRAASLLNVIVPRIEAQIEQISDPEEKAALRARLERLGDKVEIAAANRSRERLRQDVMLSIETLEEQIDARLPSDTPSGP